MADCTTIVIGVNGSEGWTTEVIQAGAAQYTEINGPPTHTHAHTTTTSNPPPLHRAGGYTQKVISIISRHWWRSG